MRAFLPALARELFAAQAEEYAATAIALIDEVDARLIGLGIAPMNQPDGSPRARRRPIGAVMLTRNTP